MERKPRVDRWIFPCRRGIDLFSSRLLIILLWTMNGLTLG